MAVEFSFDIVSKVDQMEVKNAMDQVRGSFQYLINSWPTIVRMISIYKRLRAFEAVIRGEGLEPINLEKEMPATPE